MPIDQAGRLEQEPFSYQETKDGKVRIFYEGRQVMILVGAKAKKLIGRIQGAGDMEVQLALAKVTGNFKRGNEKIKK